MNQIMKYLCILLAVLLVGSLVWLVITKTQLGHTQMKLSECVNAPIHYDTIFREKPNTDTNVYKPKPKYVILKPKSNPVPNTKPDSNVIIPSNPVTQNYYSEVYTSPTKDLKLHWEALVSGSIEWIKFPSYVTTYPEITASKAIHDTIYSISHFGILGQATTDLTKLSSAALGVYYNYRGKWEVNVGYHREFLKGAPAPNRLLVGLKLTIL